MEGVKDSFAVNAIIAASKQCGHVKYCQKGVNE
jgi:hypothetical protein